MREQCSVGGNTEAMSHNQEVSGKQVGMTNKSHVIFKEKRGDHWKPYPVTDQRAKLQLTREFHVLDWQSGYSEHVSSGRDDCRFRLSISFV
jgi:hypothetical protein